MIKLHWIDKPQKILIIKKPEVNKIEDFLIKVIKFLNKEMRSVTFDFNQIYLEPNEYKVIVKKLGYINEWTTDTVIYC